MESNIQQVSDTALWIAMYRAQESKRPGAAFSDPLAERLAGEKGRLMVEETPHTDSMAFAMVVRTTAIDRLITKVISLGIDTVINLGAGLDTRPYRMKLPADLNWIEVDFAHMIDYKNNLLAHETPVCKLTRLTADLSDTATRRELFTKLNQQSKKALVITEGVIAYLTNEEAAALSRDIYATPNFRYWIQDYAQGKMRSNKQQKEIGKKLRQAPWKFNMPDPIGFFKSQGWRTLESIYILDEADRIGKKLPLVFPYNLLMKLFPKKLRELGNKTYGYMLFCKA